MNCEELRSPARAAFKNPIFQCLCDLRKTLENSLRPRLKSRNIESIDELGKVMS